MSELTRSPLPSTTMLRPGRSLSRPTASAASPSNSVEFIHASGSVSVLVPTYFWVLLRTSVKGLGCGAVGQYEKKCS